MAIFTAAEIEEQMTLWKAALSAVSTGQSYAMGSRTLTRANTDEIWRTLERLDVQKEALAGRTGPHFAAGRVRR